MFFWFGKICMYMPKKWLERIVKWWFMSSKFRDSPSTYLIKIFIVFSVLNVILKIAIFWLRGWNNMYSFSTCAISWLFISSSGKKAQKVDFQIFWNPFWGFTLKTDLGIHDPCISWLLFGTKNHEMRGPPVLLLSSRRHPKNFFKCFKKLQI